MGVRSTNAEAAAWAVRLDGAQLSPAEQQELDQWLAVSPGRQGALLRARAVWMSLEGEGSGQALAGTPAPGSSSAEAQDNQGAQRTGSRRLFRGWRAAAAMVAGVAVLLFTYRMSQLPGDAYQTSIGEVRRIALEDGSAITLNSDSAATVLFEKNRRTVTLQRGEGLFEVAKDKSRPFIVSSGAVAVRAVGTAFAVRALTDEVTVTVTEGVVEVTRPQEVPSRVSANQRAEIRPHHGVTVLTQNAQEAGRQLSWRDGILSFSGESLAQAVREVNRYSRRQVEVQDPDLASRPVIGIFRAGDIDAFARSTAVALGAEVQVDGQVIRLVVPAGH
jgi:transmembrane sensor